MRIRAGVFNKYAGCIEEEHRPEGEGPRGGTGPHRAPVG